MKRGEKREGKGESKCCSPIFLHTINISASSHRLAFPEVSHALGWVIGARKTATLAKLTSSPP